MSWEPEGTKGGFKRRRLQGACDICRQKKIRCDSAKMPGNRCSNCKAFDADCTHFHASQKTVYPIRPPKKPRGNVHENITEYHEKMHPLIEAILSPTYQAPSNPAIIRSTLISLASYARALENRVPVTLTASTMPEASEESGPKSVESKAIPVATDLHEVYGKSQKNDLHWLADHLKGLTVNAPYSRFFGSSSSADLVKTALEFGREYLSFSPTAELGVARYRRHEFWVIQQWEIPSPASVQDKPYTFPEPNLLDHLVSLYFDRINTFLPILHQPTFERSIKSGLHLKERDFGAAVLGVCANGSRYSNDPRVISEGTNTELSSGYQWFKQLKLFRENFFSAPSLHELQTDFLAILYLHGTSTPEKCWYLIGMAIRAAQDAGIHRRDPNPEHPTIESELRKRIWWAFTLADVIVSIAVGRPRSVHPSDYDVDLPIACDDEFWENEDPSLAFKQPPGRPSTVVAFNNILTLFNILSSAQACFYCIKPYHNGLLVEVGWEEKALAELDSALNAWVDAVPDHLRWDPNRTHKVFFDQSAFLFGTFYWVQILVHRPFIASRNRLTLAFSSLAICTNAARACSRILQAHSQRGFLPLPQIQAALFLSGLVLLLTIWRAKQAGIPLDEDREMEGVHRCARVLASFEGRWHPAGRFHDVLRCLSIVSNLPWPTPTPSSGNDMEGSDGTASTALSEEVSDGLPDVSGSSLSQMSFEFPVYSTDLSKPIFRSYQQADINNNFVDDFEAMFSQTPATNNVVNNYDGGGFFAGGFTADSDQSFANAANPASASSENIGMGLGDMALWTGVPSAFDWSDWGTYIASVEAISQNGCPTAQSMI
ncbi:hypothetical protein FA15DRAFT_621825 [Coprinopsis marcescibilis]|uniref:Zn(2)-C6 fungal-type domain-containing protein n=1 Tax=Coprinopsis marcescibilis TaxID=230819 RepID=A0A5C3KRP0_COPMA|nr:hypothetical protein FA15DRAFT_621825 [Coprinopsis marcescibilis]